MDTRLFSVGIYTVPDAARLLKVPYQKLRGWVIGYSRTQGEPIVRNQLERLGGKDAISFTNLMEARMINYFASYGVHLNSIRAIVKEARHVLKRDHPFATDLIFTTDGKRIIAKVQQETGDPKLYDLRAKNWALYDIWKEGLLAGVEFSPDSEAVCWLPRSDIAPHVIVNPKVSFGQPVLMDSMVSTETLFDAFNSEDEDYESIAGWFEIEPSQVREAVKFELELKMAA